jgi:DNA-binding NarL/FixJ family response regulator
MRETPTTLAVAEDHHVTMQGIASWFEHVSDFSLIARCATREAVLEMLRESKPDLLLLDLHMPGEMPLSELIQQCSAICPVVVFSAENRPFFITLALENGAAAFVQKSQDFRCLVEVLRSVKTGARGLIAPEVNIHSALTGSQRDILSLLAQGKKYEEIAEIRGTTKETVRKQCDKLLIRLALRNREELIAWASENGFANKQ